MFDIVTFRSQTRKEGECGSRADFMVEGDQRETAG